ncbi:MAG: cellulase family glycosylhydrolase [Aureispira sp.]
MKFLFTLVLGFFSPVYLFAQTPVQTNGQLSVTGSQIVNQYGQAVSFAGASLFWSNNYWGGEAFYNASTISWLKNDWGVALVRAAMGVEDNGGYLSDSTSNKARVKAVVDAAINEGLYVIIDWHSHHAEQHQAEAIAFFQEMATLYGQYDNVIYEIYNEPLQVSWNNTIKPYANAVVAAIRAIDSSNLIIVGTPTWSQDVDVASHNPITGYSNIAYTLHFYAGTHGQSIRNKAITALNNGIALMATEWGTVNANGNGAVDSVSTAEWMTFLCNNNISHCNWAINDKLEGASALVNGASNTGNWSANDLTPSGTLVKGIIGNWDGDCNPIFTTTPSVHKKKALPTIEIFPNPASQSSQLSLKIDNKANEAVQVQWYNGVGLLLQEETVQLKKGESIQEISIPKLTSGMYFIVIKGKENRYSQTISIY